MSALTDLLGGAPHDWMSNPARNCADITRADEWFPVAEIAESRGGKSQRSRDAMRAARALCSGCPVANECLSYALVNDERHGVWGGTTPRQRLDMLAREGGAA